MQTGAYLDVEYAQVFESIRSVLFCVCYWDVLDLFGLPVAISKGEIGDGPVHLGLEFHMAHGRTIPSSVKLALINEWITRVFGLEKVERREMVSLLGTMPFCAFSVKHGGLALRPLFRSAHRQVVPYRAK